MAIAAKSEATRAAAYRLYPDAAVASDYREVLARDDVDVVSVAVPNHLHHPVATAALEADKHVLLEKPMALEVRHCDELIRLARRKQRTLAVGHELRLSRLWGRAKELIDAGAIGRPQHVLIELSRFPYRPGAEGWRYDLARVGSWILEEPIHFFDLARWYFSASGEPVSVYARANGRHEDRPELRDNFSAIVNFRGGAYAVVSQTLVAFGHHQTAKIVGSEGTLWAAWSANDARSKEPVFSLRYGLGENVEQEVIETVPGELAELEAEIAAVTECVRANTPPPCTGEDGRWSTLLCLAAEKSAALGQVVELRDDLTEQNGPQE